MSMATDLPTARASRWVPPRRDNPQFDLRLTELGGLRCNDQVADHGQFAAAAQAVAADRGHDRFGDLLHGIPVADKRAGHHVDDGCIGHLLDIGAGRKGLFAAGNHNAANVVVGIEDLEGPDQFVHQRAVESIERLGTI